MRSGSLAVVLLRRRRYFAACTPPRITRTRRRTEPAASGGSSTVIVAGATTSSIGCGGGPLLGTPYGTSGVCDHGVSTLSALTATTRYSVSTRSEPDSTCWKVIVVAPGGIVRASPVRFSK